MVEKFLPSNATQGDGFIADWCYRCARHSTEPGEGCEIFGRTQAYQVDDPEYPEQWRYGQDGPECAAFIPEGEPLPAPRCDKTVDMFGGGK